MGQNLANPLGDNLVRSYDVPSFPWFSSGGWCSWKCCWKVLVDGYRTGDIYREGLKRVGTTEMAQAVIERL